MSPQTGSRSSKAAPQDQQVQYVDENGNPVQMVD
eukprot:CAMPEP_0176282266 /NCGR_PEP_ID=MMETSP0121_2-20121125/50718_1 /TAXON_ID=160619 /ORGANISM="Kryptoperidinium foliaceum, Strain CCMP 1326" /LENGTH=33 /DNA_ID= /DNA_START= /DNA_END= /DNA_ORIENTATION=